VVVRIDCRLSLLFDIVHFLRMVVVVCQRAVDIGHVEIVPLRDSVRGKPTVFDLDFNESNRDPATIEMGFVVEVVNDSTSDAAHIRCFVGIALERPATN
jgi:hypothetical protein